MKKLSAWLSDYGGLLLAIGGLVLAWYFVRRQAWPTEAIQRELEAVQEAREVRELAADTSADIARAEVERRYKEELQALDEQQKAKAVELRRDPAGLAKFLVRAARRRESLVFALVVGLVLGPFAAGAEPLVPACDPERPTFCAVEVEKGAPALFKGQLLTTDLAIELGLKAEYADELAKREVRHVWDLASVEIKRAEEKQQASAEEAARLASILKVTSGAEPPAPGLLEQPVVLVGGGALVGALIATIIWKVKE